MDRDGDTLEEAIRTALVIIGRKGFHGGYSETLEGLSERFGARIMINEGRL